MEFLLKHEAQIRLITFTSMLLIMAIWEFIQPCRGLMRNRLFRWGSNLGLVVTSTLMLKLLVPVLAVAFAIKLEAKGWGLFNLLDWPMLLEVLLTIVLMDLWIYWQHRLMHVVPWFWRLHRVHHTDLDYDFTTAIRFHPVEIVFSMGLKLLAILIFGGPAIAIFIYEIILSSFAIFNHGNVQIAKPVESILRWFVVTPDFHRVHHSTINQETNSNYGNFLSLWDRLFGSYQAQPTNGHRDMVLGLNEFRDEKQQSFISLLLQPIKNIQTLETPRSAKRSQDET